MGRAQLSSSVAYVTSIMSNKTFLIPDSWFQAQIKENTKVPRHWPLKGESAGDRWTPHKRPVTRKCIYLMTSWCLWLYLIISKASCYLNHAISGFFITKITPRIIFTEISCKFIFFTLEIVGLVQWNLKMYFILLPNWWYMYNHDNDGVRVFQLNTLVGKFNVMDLYINIASLHGADACCIDRCLIFS